MRFQITLRAYFRPCGHIWFSSVQQAQKLESEKKKERKKEEESLVKYKSADNYVGRPKRVGLKELKDRSLSFARYYSIATEASGSASSLTVLLTNTCEGTKYQIPNTCHNLGI